MKSIFSGFIVAVITFLIGISIPDLSQFRADPASETIIVKTVDDTNLFNLPPETSTRTLDKKDILPPGPLYRFPKSGLYFSTEKDSDGQSRFQFKLRYETYYRTRTVRGVKREDKILIPPGADDAFDQKRDFRNPSVKIKGDKIILKTSVVKGVRYELEGKFTGVEYFENEDDEQIVLKGILRKFVNGKKIFEKEFEFYYEVGC